MQQRVGAAKVETIGDTVKVELKAGGRVEFAPKNATSIFASRTEMRKQH
jgi:hypothetical protein